MMQTHDSRCGVDFRFRFYLNLIICPVNTVNSAIIKLFLGYKYIRNG